MRAYYSYYNTSLLVLDEYNLKQKSLYELYTLRKKINNEENEINNEENEINNEENEINNEENVILIENKEIKGNISN